MAAESVEVDADKSWATNIKVEESEITIWNSDEGDEDDDDDDDDYADDEYDDDDYNYKQKVLVTQNGEPPENSKKTLTPFVDSHLRGLHPSGQDTGPWEKSIPIDHSYFETLPSRNRSEPSGCGLGRAGGRDGGGTLPFRNENRTEQLTVDFQRVKANEVTSASGDKRAVDEFRAKVNFLRRNFWNFKSGTDEGGANESVGERSKSRSDESDGCDGGGDDNDEDDDDDDDTSLRPGTCDALDTQTGDCNRPGVRSSGPRRNVSGRVFGDDERTNPSGRKRSVESNRFPVTDRVPNGFVSVRDLVGKLRNMQKLLKAKYDKKFSGQGAEEKIPPPKLKRMIGRGKGEDYEKMSEYLFPMPNLTKMTAGSKNWRVDYMDDDAKILGLDDLLLKASELNAENFTKALGRKLDSVKSNFGHKDNSEIVLTIPKGRRPSNEVASDTGDADQSKRPNAKSKKADFTNAAFETGKRKESDGGGKGPTETTVSSSPKKQGIKVKTVANINDEFQDSLEKKVLKDSSQGLSRGEVTASESGKDVAASSDGHRDTSQPSNGVEALSSSRDDAAASVAATADYGDDSEPFIMTIVQGKAEKQRPAILRNSTYFKKKTVHSETFKNGEKVARESERVDETMEKRPSGDGKRVDGSVTSKITTTATAPPPAAAADDALSESNSNDGFFPKTIGEMTEEDASVRSAAVAKSRLPFKKKNIPFILNHSRKFRQVESSGGTGSSKPGPPSNKLVKGTEGSSDKVVSGPEKVFRVTSIEQKLGAKETNRRFIKVVPYEPGAKPGKRSESNGSGSESQVKTPDEEPGKDLKGNQILSLAAFSNILKEILPDKWFLCLDKKYGLQIIRTHVDDFLNPSILISVVIARCGKLTVNVRGKQLDQSHQLFSNLCNIANSDNKLSLNYVLAIINKLRYLGVCFGCDPSLKKYWDDEGFIETHHDQVEQIYRSHCCHMLVSLGKKRCYPCYRMNESLKKRCRRDKMEEKVKENPGKESVATTPTTTTTTTPPSSASSSSSAESRSDRLESATKTPNSGDAAPVPASASTTPARGVKRNLEDFLEESFSTMKQQIADEIEKNKKLGERENALKAQEEVLSFMGLARKDSLGGNPVRKSKRMKSTFYKSQQPVKKKIDQKELEFLEKYWTDINTLFSTSLLFGAYSRTGRSRLREKCKMFHKLLSTWRDIVKTNPEWIGGDIMLSDNLNVDGKNSGGDQFEKMDVIALRAYIINSVKEVNRLKHKLRTRNSYFKILYNKFVKRRMKRPKTLVSCSPTPADKEGLDESANSDKGTTTPNTSTEASSDENSRDRDTRDGDEAVSTTTTTASNETSSVPPKDC